MAGGRLTDLIRPRDDRAARWAASVIGSVCAALVVGYEVLGLTLGRASSNRATLATAVVVSVLLLAMIGGLRNAPERMPPWTWMALSLTGLVVIVVIDLLAPEPGPSGQVGLLYAVVFAAAHLRPVGAWTVSVSACAADAIITFHTYPARDAFAELIAVCAVILLVTVLLVQMGRHQQELTDRLAELAAVDPLTGLATRRELDTAAALALVPRPVRRRDPPARGTALLIVDLDRLKELNDAHGHQVGDAALVHVAGLVRCCVPRQATVARLGGDEFAVLLPDCGADAAARVAEAVLDEVLTGPLCLGRESVALSVSLGVAHVPAGGEPQLSELYAAADAALYRAKTAGRGRVDIGSLIEAT